MSGCLTIETSLEQTLILYNTIEAVVFLDHETSISITVKSGKEFIFHFLDNIKAYEATKKTITTKLIWEA